MTEERTFSNAPESVAKARAYTLAAIAGVAPDTVDAIAIMVSELATNAVRHASTEFTVAIDREEHRIRVSVTDGGAQRPNLKSPGPSEHSGRGLQIVSTLADEWGVTDMIDRPGKTVWFVVALHPDHSEAEVEASDERRPGTQRPDSGSRERSRPSPSVTTRRDGYLGSVRRHDERSRTGWSARRICASPSRATTTRSS